jgi:Flp pilus assembly protein TadG
MAQCEGRRRRWRDDRGALTLSYVAILPFVFLFMMVLIQTSFWFLARNAALAAARQGADAARALHASRAAGPAAAMAFAPRRVKATSWSRGRPLAAAPARRSRSR